MKRGGIPFLEISAKNNYEFGYKLGKALKKEIRYRLKKNKIVYWENSRNREEFSMLTKKSEKFIPAIKKHFPHLLIEAQAMANGAEVPFEELFILMCENEVVDFKILHCTSIAVRTDDGKILIGHNEDWFPECKKNGLVVIKGRIGKNKFIASSFIGSMVGSSVSLNSHGLAYTDNSLLYTKMSPGIPRSFQLRALLDAKNLKDAVRILGTDGTTAANTLLAWSNKKFMDVEELWNNEEIFYGKRFLVHTNHPLLKKYDRKYNVPHDSVRRYKQAVKILENEEELTINSVKKVMTNHTGGICDHEMNPHSKYYPPTIASYIINPKEKWMMVCHGNPCCHEYKKYYL